MVDGEEVAWEKGSCTDGTVPEKIADARVGFAKEVEDLAWDLGLVDRKFNLCQGHVQLPCKRFVQ